MNNIKLTILRILQTKETHNNIRQHAHTHTLTHSYPYKDTQLQEGGGQPLPHHYPQNVNY